MLYLLVFTFGWKQIRPASWGRSPQLMVTNFLGQKRRYITKFPIFRRFFRAKKVRKTRKTRRKSRQKLAKRRKKQRKCKWHSTVTARDDFRIYILPQRYMLAKVSLQFYVFLKALSLSCIYNCVSVRVVEFELVYFKMLTPP